MKPARSCIELLNAISPFGHAAEPWKTWALLHDLEQATGNAPAAADAWQQAVQCYLAYRRAGGESQEPGAQLCAQIAHAIRQGDTTEVTQFLAQAERQPTRQPGSRPCCPNCTPSSTATVTPPSPPTQRWTTTMLRSCSCCWRRWEWGKWKASGQPSAVSETRRNNALRIFATPTSTRLILLSLLLLNTAS